MFYDLPLDECALKSRLGITWLSCGIWTTARRHTKADTRRFARQVLFLDRCHHEGQSDWMNLVEAVRSPNPGHPPSCSHVPLKLSRTDSRSKASHLRGRVFRGTHSQDDHSHLDVS